MVASGWVCTLKASRRTAEGLVTPGTMRGGSATYQYEEGLLYIWEHFVRILPNVSMFPPSSEKGAISSASGRLLTDVKTCNAVFSHHFSHVGIGGGPLASVDDLDSIVRDVVHTCIGHMVDTSLLRDMFPKLCSHLGPSPVVAYAILAGGAASLILGPLMAPKMKHWISVLLSIPAGEEPVGPSIDDLIVENVALRRELQLAKRQRTASEFEVQGSVVKCRQQQGFRKDQNQRDKMNILSTLWSS